MQLTKMFNAAARAVVIKIMHKLSIYIYKELSILSMSMKTFFYVVCHEILPLRSNQLELIASDLKVDTSIYWLLLS